MGIYTDLHQQQTREITRALTQRQEKENERSKNAQILKNEKAYKDSQKTMLEMCDNQIIELLNENYSNYITEPKEAFIFNSRASTRNEITEEIISGLKREGIYNYQDISKAEKLIYNNYDKHNKKLYNMYNLDNEARLYEYNQQLEAEKIKYNEIIQEEQEKALKWSVAINLIKKILVLLLIIASLPIYIIWQVIKNAN